MTKQPKPDMLTQKVNSRVKETPTGRKYIHLSDHMQAIDETADAIDEAGAYIRDGEVTSSQTAEQLHRLWAFMQDPGMTEQDYLDNCERCAGYGPKPHRQLLNVHPATPRPKMHRGG